MRDLKALAQETLRVATAGHYTAPSGARRSIAELQRDALANTEHFTPEHEDELFRALRGLERSRKPVVTEVCRGGTTTCGRRLAQTEGRPHVVALNFASGRNPGGGFLKGSVAQEEDLARCSGLYPCLAQRDFFYEKNRASGSALYADELIYSPAVPFFRDEALNLLEEPFALSIITSPAPNAGIALERDASSGPAVEAALTRRAWQVLAVAAAKGHRTLVLGAWGCGVFRNDPAVVARVFADWLAHEDFRGAFEHVSFALLARKPSENLRAFEARFGPALD